MPTFSKLLNWTRMIRSQKACLIVRPIPTKHWAFTPVMTMVAGPLVNSSLWMEKRHPAAYTNPAIAIPCLYLRVTLRSGGIVPFGCLFIEMYFILSAVWSHNKIYYVYGFMFAILVLLCLVIICVSITCTYILLNAEDYRWQWQSYISCAATALYVFLYTIHYFYNSTQMSQAQKF